jgi:hypothetical protein
MKVEIVNRNLESDAVTAQRMKDRVRRTLSRLRAQVDRVVVRVSALAGRGGAESRECLVLVRLAGGGEVVARARGERPVDLVVSALRQARSGVLKRLDRMRGR